ncbi:hypothetical protein [Dethiothermospora halolimnae]|uniref:hypothetical protein n=1 Tax=Dethiothermospora halolimnae TaxID=3114390 RepID=UPI003CCBA9F6
MWRVDLLFNTDSDIVIAKETDTPEKTDIAEKNTNLIEENDTSIEEASDKEVNDLEDNGVKSDSNSEDIQDSETNNEKSNEDKNNTGSNDKENTDEVVNISIPEGTSAFKIADILVDKGLVDNKWNFLNTATELKLDTKLKPGEFKIKKNSSLETMVKILAK